jgi:hypothetical protein
MESGFKIYDRVFHYSNGWGTITRIVFEDGYKLIQVDFDNRVLNSFTYNHIKLLSFTEYTLQGFSQERPIVLPEIGETCLFRDIDNERWTASEYLGFVNGTSYPYETINGVYRQCRRIKILD